MLEFALILNIMLLSVLSVGNAEEPTISINNTIIVGSLLKSWRGGDFWGFRGIRFAHPPVGEFRFKDPQKLENTFIDEIYDARNDRNDCPSIYATHPSEDGLFLNVYTQTVKPNSTTKPLRPVIAFIHPGGFYVGSALSSFIGPEYLLDKPVVLVTFNYRLAALGFLNLGTSEYPGNAGLKDQIFALRWIQQYIKHFGGNPNDVTLMGYSAGGVSVSLHLASKMSAGLFHRAIIMSGSVPPQTQIPEAHQMNLVGKQAETVACTQINLNSSEALIGCLKSKSTAELTNSLRQMFKFGNDNPIYLWLPIIERDFGQERFLTTNPYKQIKDGDFNKVPILIGFTNREFCTSSKDIVTNPTLLNQLNSGFADIAPICFMYEGLEKKLQISNRILWHYFQNKTIDKEAFDELCDIFSDSIIRFGANHLATLASAYTNVYRYRYAYTGRFSHLYYPGPTDVNGAEHLDDLMYLFKMNPHFNPTDPEASQIELMTQFITNFASTKSYTDFKEWEFATGKYVEITTDINLKSDSYFSRYDLLCDWFL